MKGDAEHSIHRASMPTWFMVGLLLASLRLDSAAMQGVTATRPTRLFSTGTWHLSGVCLWPRLYGPIPFLSKTRLVPSLDPGSST